MFVHYKMSDLLDDVYLEKPWKVQAMGVEFSAYCAAIRATIQRRWILEEGVYVSCTLSGLIDLLIVITLITPYYIIIYNWII